MLTTSFPPSPLSLSLGRARAENPPPILTSDPEYVRALLFHARDEAGQIPEDTPENRRKGWRRIILYANFFIPGAAIADAGLGPVSVALKQPTYPLGWGKRDPLISHSKH